MDTKITDPEANRFYKVFSAYRKINREFYELVPEDKFDFRLVDSSERRSDSVRESLAHQINVQHSYLKNAVSGKSEFGISYDHKLKLLSKTELLQLLEKADNKLVEFLCLNENLAKLVIVRWSPKPITALQYLWSLNDHEIFHNGWNVACMDALNIPRFPALKHMWG